MNKSWQKLIKSLHQKKYRVEEQLFLVEGEKSVVELLTSSMRCKGLFYTQKFYDSYSILLKKQSAEQALVTENLLAQVGTLQSNDAALAVVEIPTNQVISSPKDYVLALSDIRDPGNLGTIIRIADWYGITQIVCSTTTVDWYNPKVITSSMGSFLRVQPFYCELTTWLKQQDCAIYGAVLNGNDMHTIDFAPRGVIVIGNESNGIDASILPLLTTTLTISRFGGAESLNAGIATAVICDNWRRSMRR